MPNPANPLDALRKAQSIQPAPPDRGYFSADTDHPVLNTATDILKGLTGLGDQGPSGMTATNFGQLLGAAIPFAGLRKAGAGPRIVEDLMDEVGHRFKPGPMPVAPPSDAPAFTQAFIQHLNDAEPTAIDPAQKFLAERTNSYYAHPPSRIQAPEGFNFPGNGDNRWGSPKSVEVARPDELNALYQRQQDALARFRPTPTAVNKVKSVDDLQFITSPGAPQRSAPPALSGKWGRAGTAGKVNETQVREIRALASQGEDIDWIGRKYGIHPSTVTNIVKGESFQRIK